MWPIQMKIAEAVAELRVLEGLCRWCPSQNRLKCALYHHTQPKWVAWHLLRLVKRTNKLTQRISSSFASIFKYSAKQNLSALTLAVALLYWIMNSPESWAHF